MSSKFINNIGPGTVIGAVAMGDGAKAEGSVVIGGTSAQLPDLIRCNVEIRHCMPQRAAKWLRQLADQLDNETATTFAASKAGASIAWSVTGDTEK